MPGKTKDRVFVITEDKEFGEAAKTIVVNNSLSVILKN
jgi:hypothetical protein